MKHPGKTLPFRGPDGAILAGSIAQVRYVKLGGLDQWVLIRGERIANPALILLHGGPGFSENHFFLHFNSILEKHFTVVYWDQRGSGKSFNSRIPASSMTVEQFLVDLDELIEEVFKRVGRKPVVIFGHSWGSALGVLYAARFPEKVAVYVGAAQIGDWVAAEATSYGLAISEAKRLNNDKALKELTAIGPPPYDARSVFTERTWHQRLSGHLTARTLWSMVRMFFGKPELSLFDLPNLFRGFRFSLDAMWPDVSRLNLMASVPALTMPVFFFLGRRDRWVPPETSVAYFDALSAPSKKLVWFEESEHEMFADEPARFNTAMIEWVRPIVAMR